MNNMKVNKIYLIALGIIYNVHISAQVTFDSLKDVLNYADKHEISIQTALINEHIATAKANQTKSQLYPQITGSAGYNDNISLQPTLVPANLFNPSAPEGEYQKYKFGKKYTSDASVTLQWSILDFQKSLAARMASNEIKISKLSTASSKWNTYMNLASVYYSILITRRSMDFYKENVKKADLLLNNGLDKYKNGAISKDVLDRTMIQQINAQKELHATESSLEKLICQLQSYLAIKDEIIVTDNVDKRINTEMDLHFETEHPEIKYKESLLNYNRLQLKQAKALNYPSLSLTYQYQYNWAADRLMDYGSAISYNTQFIGVKLSIPLFTGFHNKHKIKEAEWNMKQTQYELDAVRITRDKEDEMLKIDYLQSRHDYECESRILNLRQDADSKINDKYQKGVISLDERLDKYQDLLNEQNNYIRNMGNYLIAQYQVYIRHINF